MEIPVSFGSKDVCNAADVTAQYLEFVSCPDCSMIASAQWGGCLDSTEGPVEHVRVTCLYRHWFVMPVETFTERQSNH
jgi:hypothetical protein